MKDKTRPLTTGLHDLSITEERIKKNLNFYQDQAKLIVEILGVDQAEYYLKNALQFYPHLIENELKKLRPISR